MATTTLRALDREIEGARYELRELWWKASPADRIFAVDRYLRDGWFVDERAEAELQRTQDAVRNAWATARAASTLVNVDTQLASLQLMLAERDRDNVLAKYAMFDALFATAEGYLHDGNPFFRELVHERDRRRARLVPILPPVDD
jgi:hypothetical protein